MQTECYEVLDPPITLGKEVISSVDMDHTIFERRLPLVLYSLDLQTYKLRWGTER